MYQKEGHKKSDDYKTLSTEPGTKQAIIIECCVIIFVIFSLNVSQCHVIIDNENWTVKTLKFNHEAQLLSRSDFNHMHNLRKPFTSITAYTIVTNTQSRYH